MNKVKKIIKKGFKSFTRYISTNRLFLSYVILSLISTILLRYYTIGHALSFKPVLVDLALIVIIGSFGYLLKPRKQFYYFFTWFLIFTLTNIINAIYYTFYISFATFGLVSSLGQVSEVGDSVLEKLTFTHFIYLIPLILFIIANKVLHKGNYFNFLNKVEKSKKLMLGTLIAGFCVLGLRGFTVTASEITQTAKQWNREFVVERFGIILYQTNDLVQSLTPKINQLFGYDKSAREFREFYCDREVVTKKNKYTNIFKYKNVVFVHMESVQSFALDLKFNNQEVTPNINRLIKQSMYFNNFYPQVSVGNSADTEFTLQASLMPALSGTVFVSYTDTYYETIMKILREKGYYAFSMHANNAAMWNRAVAHKSLGYEEFYAKPYYTIDETIGLGLSDKSFFKQIVPYLETIEQNHTNYAGTVITLTNHSPFDRISQYGEFNLTENIKITDTETGEEKIIEDTHIETSKMGNYLKSLHYTDEALGEFIKYINESEYFDDTVFVFYGDHDARLSKKEFNRLYNYDVANNDFLSEDDPNYYNYDYYEQQLIKKTPLFIWTKDHKYKGVYDYYMGMIDILPTLANMMGFDYNYALGNDIFTIKNDNTVVFPNANFLTNKMYYNSVKEEYKVFDDAIIPEGYIDEKKEYVEKILDMSNNIIVYDLIAKERENLIEMSCDVSEE